LTIYLNEIRIFKSYFYKTKIQTKITYLYPCVILFHKLLKKTDEMLHEIVRKYAKGFLLQRNLMLVRTLLPF